MFIKISIMIFISISFLRASCVSNINIDFDFNAHNITVKSKVYDSKKSIQLNYDGFKIKDIEKLDVLLNNGSNNIEFLYSKDIKSLNKEYILLLGNWYPDIRGGCSYRITTNLDDVYKNIYENTQINIDKVTFVASKKFITNTKSYNNIKIQTYFFKDDKKLSIKYINKSIEYIKLYEKLIGKFPYKKFRIVENVYTTGYSMPTYTLVGSRLLNKPYILNQSLGHEILHQYFGNSIFNDVRNGNWVEGITTYLGDDYYKELDGSDINGRKIVLNEYENFIKKDKEFPINEFTHRFDKSSQLIGYSKLSFVFHMLKNDLGENEFYRIIKKLYNQNKYKNLSLKELTLFFNENSQIELSGFFNQWLNKKGTIDFEIKDINNYYDKNGHWLNFNIIQNEKNFYGFNLPISINTYDKKVVKTIKIKKAHQNIKLNFDSEILDMTIDENIDLFRKLSKNERLLSISSLMNKDNLIAIVNKSDAEKYKNIKNIFPEANIVYSDDIKFKDLKNNTILFLDAQNELLNHFYPNININPDNSFLVLKKHIYNKNSQMAVLNFGKYKSGYLKMLKHYSKYKEVIFKKDKIIKKIDDSKTGIVVNFNKLPKIIVIKNKNNIKKIYDDIKDNRIIYVGESHDKFNHHLNQLRVIKTLHENGKKLSIGMEMFQTKFQKDLNEYVEGKSTLNEFLKNSEYFKRWKFDYNLYKPIIDFARANKIPIVALNIDRKITKNISKNGILSLNKEQKKLLPYKIDQSNLKYKKSLDSIFEEHMPKSKDDNKHSSSKINLDYFYQSQLVWDEVMAQNIHKYMKGKIDTTMVVIVGSGHVLEHNGIPFRVYERNKLPYKVILNDTYSSKTGDIVVENETKTKIKKQQKLGAYLKTDEDLIVLRTVKDSFSNKIGIKKNDKIVEVDNKKVDTLYDIKRVLYFIDKIDDSTVKVKRDGKIIELNKK